MAESQIAGLFMTPEMYRRQQMQEADQQAVNFARMSPREQASYGFFSAGQGLGRAAGTLLGAQDPQLQRITEQQQLLQGLDVADPESLMEAARRASQAGNTPLAMQLAGRAQEISANSALISQRNRSNNPIQALLSSGKYTPASIAAFAESGDATDLVLATPARQPQRLGDDREAKSLELYQKAYIDLTPEERTAVEAALKKPAAAPSFGTEAERVARELYGRGYGELTQQQMAEVNRRVDERAVRTASAGAPKVVLPTSTPQDIAKFRSDVQRTIAPQLAAITASDQTLALLRDAREANNPVAYNAARAQLARAFSGGGDLSRREIESAGGDPSIIGIIQNTLSTAVDGTPTFEQQRNMKRVAEIIKRVATNRARGEIRTQRDLAIRSGSSQSDVDLALRFSEFGDEPPAPTAPSGGSSTPSNTFLGAVRQSARSSQQTATPAQSRLDAALQRYAPQ
jgi:hypothetical protein